MLFQNSLFDKFRGKWQHENCLKYNLLWLTEDSYFFLSLLCNFWKDCNDTILRGKKKVKNKTVPIFCKLIKLIYNPMHSEPDVFFQFNALLPSIRIHNFTEIFIFPIMQFWWALHVSRDCYPGFPSETGFKVLLVIKDEKQRYLTLFLRAHQKERLWL